MIPDTAIGAIIAAIIAATISIVSLIISKENKTSEFRQDWINNFRKDIATIVTNSHILEAYTTSKDENTPDHSAITWEKTRHIFAETNSAITRIDLMLNLNEPDHKSIHNTLRTLEELVATHPDIHTVHTLEKTADQLVSLSRKTLKDEWTRVKRGEKTFHIAKIVSLLLISITVIFGIFIFARQLIPFDTPTTSHSKAVTESPVESKNIYIIQ
ncbi:hypothetical protein [Chromobacterium sp. Panama]|uniref:hypothetical protein n=1 Tax=Chromobacterium sp. Panama TaxID=2161826 RepID=UPI0011B1E79A|nr:hypothetical protein [Chromobacterium sp. Panama]